MLHNNVKHRETEQYNMPYLHAASSGRTLLKKFKGAHTFAVKTDIPNFDNKIQNNQN